MTRKEQLKRKIRWKTLSAFGDWKLGVPKAKAGLLMGYGGRLDNGMYPNELKQIIVPEGIKGYGRKQNNSNFSRFELTDKEIKRFAKGDFIHKGDLI